MRNGCKKIALTMGCGLLVLAMLANIQQFMMRKISYWGYADFYSYKGDYDVLFFGSSTMNMENITDGAVE